MTRIADSGLSSLALVPCPGCRLRLPEVATGTHPYIGASSGCRSRFGELLAKEFADLRYARFHRLTVDAYAAQHPGAPSPQSIRSVAIHLMALCLMLDRNVPIPTAQRTFALLARRDQELRWLDPPDPIGMTTVADVLAAVDPDDHSDRVRRWAAEVWNAWSAHHELVRFWLDRSMRLL